MAYEVLDISGDIGIKAYGNSCEDVFINAGLGMYSLITDIEGVEGKKDLTIEASADSLEGLMVNYLNELVFHFDTYGFIGMEIRGLSLTPPCLPLRGLSRIYGVVSTRRIGAVPAASQNHNYTLKACIYGEDFDPDRHERKLLIKAATYHKIRVEKTGGKWEAEVIFDI